MKKLLLTLLFVCNSALASDCAELYPESKPIEVKNTVELCNSFFVSVYDAKHQRVILVSEHLHHGNVGSVSRIDAFRSDSRIGNRPNPTQYTNTGFDRGHMAPAEDASNAKEMRDTFLMTNMTPQNPTLNRNEWKSLEERIRKLFKNSKSDMYILTIAIYGNDVKMNGIPVPIGYWKIVTVDGFTQYFYADNVDHGKVVQKDVVAINSLLPQ